MKNRKSIAIITSTDMTVKAFLLGHIRTLADYYDVTVITNTGTPQFLATMGMNVQVHHLDIARSIKPVSDLSSLIRLIRYFHIRRFDVIFSVTPKAGLLSMFAGLLVRIPLRVHMFTGQVWATRRGIDRRFLKFFDFLLAFAATHLLADSESQRQFLIRETILADQRCHVLAGGSICGVDAMRFKPDQQSRQKVRGSLAIPQGATLLLFLGRQNREKGVLDLAHAFAGLGNNSLHLAFVGPDEGGLRAQIAVICRNHATQLHFIDFTAYPETFMAAADILCLPSYREGFGSVVIEAAATGIPAVASRIYGLTDAVEDRVTGILHEPGNVGDIVRCLSMLIDSPERRLAMGHAARARALRDFPAERVTQALLDYLRLNIETRGTQ